MHTHFHYHGCQPETPPDHRLDTLLGLVLQLQKDVTSMSGNVKELQAAQAKTDGAIDAAVAKLAEQGTALKDLAAKLEAASADPAAIAAVAADLNTRADSLLAATANLAANTDTPNPPGLPAPSDGGGAEPTPEPDAGPSV